MKTRLWTFILTIVILIQVSVVAWSNRWIFTKSCDASYWEDRYNSSQWVFPISTRVIGDEGLYLHVGDLLVHGTDPTKINAETPPLGKYMIGLSCQLFNRPYAYSFIIYALSIVIFYFLALTILSGAIPALIATTIFSMDPLVSYQTTVPMLDSTALLFLIIYFLGLGQFEKTNRYYWIILAGIAAGCFGATKFPLQTLLLIPPLLFIIRKKRLAYLLLFCFTGGTIYCLSYLRFFIITPSVWDFLKVQKWMIDFYAQSNLHANIGSVFTNLFINRIQNLFTYTWESGNIWTPIWFLSCIAGICTVWKHKKTKIDPIFISLLVFVGSGLLFYTFIPFWTRYLLIIIPFLYIILVQFLLKNLHRIQLLPTVAGIIIIQGITLAHIIFPNPSADFRQFAYDWNNGFFQDVYERIPPSEKTVSRNDFYKTGKSLFSKLSIEIADVSIPKIQWSGLTYEQTIKTNVTYYTRELGPYTVPVTIPAKNISGKWYFSWDWSYLGIGVQPTSTAEVIVDRAKRGTIFDSNSKIQAEDIPGYLIVVRPDLIPERMEEPFLRTIELMTKQKLDRRISYFDAQNRLKIYGAMGIPLTIGTIGNMISNKDNQSIIMKLKTFPGVTLIPTTVRWYANPENTCIGTVTNQLFQKQSLFLYTTNNYDGTMGIELEQNETLKGYNGGTITITNPDGSAHTILSVQKKNGASIFLPRDRCK